MAGTGKTSDRVALGGIVAALCIVIMFLTGVVRRLEQWLSRSRRG